jgi:hypothetical protein
MKSHVLRFGLVGGVVAALLGVAILVPPFGRLSACFTPPKGLAGDSGGEISE